MVVMMDMQLLGNSGSRGHKALELSLERRGGAVRNRLMVEKLLTQRLNLVVGVEQHLSQLSDAQLKVGIVLEEVTHEVVDNRIARLRVLKRLGRSSTL
jgi:hypothetical protein